LCGRFLEVDPVEGGSCNDYDYVCGDTINAFDLDGEICFSCAAKAVVKTVAKVARNPVVQAVGGTAACLGSSGLLCAGAFAAITAINRGGKISTAIRSRNLGALGRQLVGGGVDFAIFKAGGKAVYSPTRFSRGSIREGYTQIVRVGRQTSAGTTSAIRGVNCSAQHNARTWGC
jgi:hypothetical protein